MSDNVTLSLIDTTENTSLPTATESGPTAGEEEDHYELWLLGFMVVNAVVALTGNSLSLAVFTRSRLRGAPSSGYLAALAVADSGCSLTGALLYSSMVFGYIPALVVCRLLTFLSDTFLFLSPWFVVCFTGERFVSVCHPLHAPRILARLSERKVVAAFSVLGCALYAFHVFKDSTMVWVAPSRIFVCSPPLNVFLAKFVRAFDFVTYVIGFVLPMVLIVVLNVFIILRLRRSAQKLSLGAQAVSDREERNAYITRTLLLVSLVFFICNCPTNTLMLLGELKFLLHRWAAAGIQMLYNLNFSVNFLLYAISGKKFRNSLKELCSC